VRRFLEEFRDRMLATWPVLAEACHFLPERTQIRFLRWAEQTGITDIFTIDLRDFSAYRLRTGKVLVLLRSGVNQPSRPFGGGRRPGKRACRTGA
jgi:hypothetical protein